MMTFATVVALLALAMPGYSQDKPAPKKPTAPKIITETISIGQGDAKFSCYVARPKGDKPAPGLLLIHEWWGLNDWVKKQADRYAAMGYVTLAVDLYRGEVAKDAEHAHELMRGLADERALTDLKMAYAWLVKLKQTEGKPIGAMGWCMGGGFALKLAIAEPSLACTVVCYGKPVTDVEQLKKIKGPLLGIWGETDRGIEVAPFKKALDEAGVKHEHHIYPSAGHAFLNETNKRGYNKEQAEKAWKEIDGFLAQSLKQSKNSKSRGKEAIKKTGSMLDLPWNKATDHRTKRESVKGMTGSKRAGAITAQIYQIEMPAQDDESTLQVFMSRLTRGQRIALVLWQMEGEVQNGGFAQYFSNPWGQFAPEAFASLNELELPRFSNLTNKITPLFPGSVIPRERNAREKALEKVDHSILDELTSQFFKAYGNDDDIGIALDKYIEAHPEEFYVD